MLKRSVFSGFIFLATITGCATVSVVPGVSTVETGISQDQTALRDAAERFTEKATSRGWISSSRGLFNLARVLVDGQSPDSGEAEQSYADFIGASERDGQAVLSTVLTDGKDAQIALAKVTAEANNLLAPDLADRTRAARKDLISYERVLVQAQQARRSFVDAIEQAGLEESAEVPYMLAALDAEIDIARMLAGKLATEYASRGVSGAVS